MEVHRELGGSHHRQSTRQTDEQVHTRNYAAYIMSKHFDLPKEIDEEWIG